MDLNKIATENNIIGTPCGPYLYPLSLRGRKVLSLLSDESESSEYEEEIVENIILNDSNNDVEIPEVQELNKSKSMSCKEEYSKLSTHNQGDMDSKSKKSTFSYISLEDAIDIQYARDFEYFFGVPYKPYLRHNIYRVGKNMRPPLDPLQQNSIYKNNQRLLYNDPWPQIDVSIPIPYKKQPQAPATVDKHGFPIEWIKTIKENRKNNLIFNSGKFCGDKKFLSPKGVSSSLGDAIDAWESSNALLQWNIPNILGEEKKGKKQKRVSFVRDNIRGVAEEIESWTRCPVIQVDVKKSLENSWLNVDKDITIPQVIPVKNSEMAIPNKLIQP
ncbi:uncharacterized protein CMU_041840 [Cryptosporidium muris RN66]|uniref:Uncharacterized protein n=1 Tax=Cryptosporidium muris (strain RN66) TaxID=441375 RepID=B6AA70_CRYMR|nr:uncharacterized protein CMU_041840 [Cryptosporidium muris RN66]EEA05111.1 hypothetical protein, conserved [Cryptosporidium muris RN66]|eukprot:XP_002139460.1 hypothetical protein [Cryptosporidium muris RN66]